MESAVNRLIDKGPIIPSQCALGHLTIALGGHLIAANSPRWPRTGSNRDPDVHFQEALKDRARLMDTPFSPQNFQVRNLFKASRLVVKHSQPPPSLPPGFSLYGTQFSPTTIESPAAEYPSPDVLCHSRRLVPGH